MNKEKIIKLEELGLNWFEIADILNTSYDEVRYYAEEDM